MFLSNLAACVISLIRKQSQGVAGGVGVPNIIVPRITQLCLFCCLTKKKKRNTISAAPKKSLMISSGFCNVSNFY